MKWSTRRARTLDLASAAVVFALACSSQAAPALAAEGPALAFTAEGVEITSLSPGGKVAVLGVLRWPLDYQHRIEVVDRLVEDDDGDGAVLLELLDGLPAKTAWVAVDLTSGEVTAANPAGAALSDLSEPQATLSSVDGAVIDARRFLALLVARKGAPPEAGAWFGLATDGGRLDADELGDGSLSVSASDLTALSGGDASDGPASFGVDDVVVGIDAETLEVWVLSPVASVPGGAQ